MNRQHGVTLVELLLVIVVLTTVLALGVPSFKQFIKNNRLTAQANNVVLAIQTARNEAIKRGAGTTVCAANSSLNGCAGDTDWTGGWIVFSDLNQDGVANIGTNACLETEDCILQKTAGPVKSTLTGSGADIRFLPTGLTVNGPLTLTLEADDCYKNQKRSIVVTLQGYTTVSTQPCS